MARTVYVPEAGGALNFADGTTDQQIVDYVRSKYAPPPAPVPTEAGIGALEAGLYGFRSRSQAGLGKAIQSIGFDDTANYLFEQSRANEKLASSYKPDIADISQIQSAGDVAKFAGSTIGQSAAETATGAAGIYTGAAAGAAVGSVVPLVGTAAGGIIGGVVGFAISSLPSFVGGNLQEQVRENNVTLEEASGYSAGIGAAAQAPLEFIFDKMIARRLPGGSAALDIAKKGFLREVAKTAGKGALVEGLTEPAQQAIQIAQANPEKLLEFGPEVQRELINAAAAGVLAGGVIGGAAGGLDSAISGKAPTETPAQKEISAGYTQAAQRGADMRKFAEVNAGVSNLSSQNAIGTLRLNKIRIEPTPTNGIKAPVDRFQILDTKGKSIAEFSDPVNATDAVAQYSKIVGKKINLQSIVTGAQVPTTAAPGVKTPQATVPIPTIIPEATALNAAGPKVVVPPKPPTQKALDKTPIAVRMQAIASDEIPYDTLTWDDNKKKAMPSSGKSKIVDYGGRKIVVADVNGVKVPFYLSSGLAGKSKVAPGKWYPFFGIGTDGWINKTSQEEIANYYGDSDLARVSQTLDSTIGDIRNDQSIPKVGMDGAHMGFINSGLDPSENNTSDTGLKVNTNIKRVLDKLQQTRPSKSEDIIGATDAVPNEGVEAVESATPIAVMQPEPVINLGVDEEAQLPVVNEEEQVRARKFIQDRKEKISDGVVEALRRYNLKDVQTKFVPAFLDAIGRPKTIEGTETISKGKSIVTLATDVFDPSLTVEQMVNKVVDVLNHESIHSLFDLGLIRPVERSVLLNSVSTAKVPGKQYTYLDFAKKVYDPSKPGFEAYTDPNMVAEEAIAEMFRDWRNRNTGAPQNTRGLFNRVIDSLRHIFNVMKRNRYEDIFTEIESGKVGLRERAPVSGQASKYSTIPSDYRKDNPGGNWLKGKQEDAVARAEKYPRGSTGKLLSGSVTAYAGHNKPLMLPVSELSKVKGASDENRIPGDYQFDELKKLVDESGYTNENPVMVFVNQLGDAYINEGNTRIAVANAKGIPHIAAWVHWFNGGESVNGNWSPQRVAQMESLNDEGEVKFSVAPEIPELSVAPVYPYGQRVPQVNVSDTDRVISELEYGAMITRIGNILDSKFLSIVPGKYKPSDEAITDFVRKWADKIIPVGQMIDYVKQNGGTVTDAMDVYANAQLSQSITANLLEARETDLYKPLTDFIKGNGISVGDLGRYLYALHAAERNARIRAITPKKRDENGNEIPFDPAFGSGMSDETAAGIISAVERSPMASSYAQAQQMVRKIIDDTNQLRLDSGLSPDYEVNPTTIETEDGQTVTLEPYTNYVPLRGYEDESALDGDLDNEFKARIGQGFKIKGREDMRAFGRTSEASNEDILAHIMLQNQEAVVRAEKNKVGLSFLSLIQSNPDILENYGVEVMTAQMKPMRKYLNSRGIVKTMVDPMYKNSDDVFIVKREGVEIPIRIKNRLLQKSLITNKSIDSGSNAKFVQFLGKLNRFVASMNTVYNPEFALVNFPRDIQQAMLNLTQYEVDGVKSKILKDALPAAYNVHKILRDPNAQNEWSGWYAQFRQDGGNTSGFYGAFSIDEQIRKIEKMSMEMSGSPTSRAKQAFESIKKMLEDYNGAFENAVRLSVYKNMVEAGASRQKAAFIAKNITVNFDQRGEYGPVMNSLYLFYNASVQGTLTLLTAASRSSKVRKALGGLVVFGFLQDLINSSMSQGGEDDEPLYDKLPDYKLENNIILMDPFGYTEKGYIAIPLAYGANAFVNLGRAMSRNMRGGYTTGEAATSMATTFVDAFNPVGGTESLLNFIVPTAMDPIVALSMNLDYSGRRIYPEAFPGSVPKANSQVYFSSTSPIFTNVADFLNRATGGSEYVPGYVSIKPDAMEYVYDYILGATGATARRVFDTAMNDVPKLLQGDYANIEFNNVPVLRKIYGNVSERMSFEDYFDKVNHVLLRGEELKFAMKGGDPANVREVRAKYADELKIYPAIKALANRRNKIASELRKVRENTKMPPEQKRRRQDALQKQIEDITKRVDMLYGKQIGSKYPGLFD